MLGVYTLLGQSINVKIYSNNKLRVTNICYERFLQKIHFPNSIKEDILIKDGYRYKFLLETFITMIPNIEEKRLKTISDDTEVEFIYYEYKK